MSKPVAQIAREIPLKVGGSSIFGRYPKISIEKTYNMILSDGWLVPYAGYKKVSNISETGWGRGVFSSPSYNHLIVVISNNVYQIDNNLIATKIGELNTSFGDVFIDENGAKQIAICDEKDIWIFNYEASTFTKANIDFNPMHISFHNGRFMAAVRDYPVFRLSNSNNGLIWPNDAQHVGAFNSKADLPKACIRIPGKGNNILVMGEIVTELWVDVGYSLFPYQRTSAFNIDYGCANNATVASGDNFVVWLGINEKSTPAIMYTNGSEVRQISTDGINYRLAALKHPENSCAFLFKQDGHLLYHITFYDVEDNLSLVYDFNTDKFYHLCDKNGDYHIARKVAYFNNTYFFVSLNDGNFYEFDTQFFTADDEEINRIRICNNVRLPDSSGFVVNRMAFTLEQGNIPTSTLNSNDPELPRIDTSISINGGESFSNFVGTKMNMIGNRKNIFCLYQLGFCNDFVSQFRFHGFGRFVATDGVVNITQ